ncbi:MAG: hypothetical protein NZT61_05400 [Deltaproteobacteria bacterium]|nr:hypothetical protein [Deltaproteobacteria bacterium]
MIEALSCINALSQKNFQNSASSRTKTELYKVASEVISRYFQNFPNTISAKISTDKVEDLAFVLSKLRASDERLHEKQVGCFLRELECNDPNLYHSYKAALSRVNVYPFHSHPIAHLRYGLKTAISFFWKMSSLVVLKECEAQLVLKLARRIALLSLPDLLSLDGIFWDKLKFNLPDRLMVIKGKIYVKHFDRDTIPTTQHYPQVGCPALWAKVKGNTNAIELIGKEILHRALAIIGM